MEILRCMELFFLRPSGGLNSGVLLYLMCQKCLSNATASLIVPPIFRSCYCHRACCKSVLCYPFILFIMGNSFLCCCYYMLMLCVCRVLTFMPNMVSFYTSITLHMDVKNNEKQ